MTGALETNPRRKDYVRAPGQAAVEFALVVGILLVVVLGIIEVSRLMFMNSEIENAAREGARVASLHDLTPEELHAAVVSRLALVDGDEVTVDGPDYPSDEGRCLFCEVQVTVEYRWSTLVPFLKTCGEPEPGKSMPPCLFDITLRSTATKLIENVDQ